MIYKIFNKTNSVIRLNSLNKILNGKEVLTITTENIPSEINDLISFGMIRMEQMEDKKLKNKSEKIFSSDKI